MHDRTRRLRGYPTNGPGARALGLPVRAGVHTGEMEHGPAGEVRGIAVHTGARSPRSRAGEILVSRTIRDLVAGAPIRLESRGPTSSRACPASGRYSPSPARSRPAMLRRRDGLPVESGPLRAPASLGVTDLRDEPLHERRLGVEQGKPVLLLDQEQPRHPLAQ